MKTTLLLFIAVVSLANAKISVEGSGFFPVMVQVIDIDSGSPIKGAVVRLEGLGKYIEKELDPIRQTKDLSETLGKSVTTNAEGVSVVFYHGGWASTKRDGKTIYSRQLAGTVVVELNGKEIYRKPLKDWAEQNEFNADMSSVPWIVVSPNS